MRESLLPNVRYLQRLRNFINRYRLRNKEVTLITSNCTGGIVYHWLALKFRSPFINLYMNNEDFLTALEDFDNFLASPIIECKDSGKPYPVGKSEHRGELIHFMHYSTFELAKKKWNQRIKRIDKTNLVVMHTNWPGLNAGGTLADIRRFNRLDFKYKVIFTDIKCPEYESAFYLKGLRNKNNVNKQVYATCNYLTGKRYIDMFDYIDFFNKANQNESAKQI